MEWALLSSGKYPELQLLHHIPNGGKRSASEAARFKATGVKPGVPDLCLPVPRGRYHGLYIEMKAIGGTISEHQSIWLIELAKQGYYTVASFGADSAISTIEKYLKGEIHE